MDTRLVDAARRGDALAVRSLLFHGQCTIHAKDAATGRTPLMIAALNGHEETVLELLHSAEGAHRDDPLSILDEQEALGGYTALHCEYIIVSYRFIQSSLPSTFSFFCDIEFETSRQLATPHLTFCFSFFFCCCCRYSAYSRQRCWTS
jgi:ankyrin repeat protein